MSENTKIKTSIGGSALIEGIMMRGPQKIEVALRLPDKTIYTENIEFKTIASINKFFELPMIRGFVALIDSLRLSMKCLMLSADKAAQGEETQEEPSKFEKWMTEKFGDNLFNFIMTVSMILGVLLAVVLFVWFPSFVFSLIAKAAPALGEGTLVRSLFEGVLKITLFLGYIVVVSRTPDMKRTFMYHGAEHKTIFCYENLEELTVENVKKYKRFHPRCGTSFMIIMLLVGVIIGLFITTPNPLLRTAIKLLLLPVSCGVGYELIKLCAKYDNIFTRIVAAPGLLAQRITTIEPDDSMIEIAIAAIKPVIPENGEDRI
ncbi:MAG: DUF1385 domain-containing protein [Clostridia bacterium]|nr:DUF1385 domain-containing protein [Clostridia bacterium]MBQ2153005.1 DUF1385 domain-containing protein [Clostridia bacterium]MBQ2348176.1 DUF1385 domain-containing protein [Clostridia bacterium]